MGCPGFSVTALLFYADDELILIYKEKSNELFQVCYTLPINYWDVIIQHCIEIIYTKRMINEKRVK